jgi:hypothetical protein
MNKIELKKRSEEARKAYIEGYAAGSRDSISTANKYVCDTCPLASATERARHLVGCQFEPCESCDAYDATGYDLCEYPPLKILIQALESKACIEHKK